MCGPKQRTEINTHTSDHHSIQIRQKQLPEWKTGLGRATTKGGSYRLYLPWTSQYPRVERAASGPARAASAIAFLAQFLSAFCPIYGPTNQWGPLPTGWSNHSLPWQCLCQGMLATVCLPKLFYHGSLPEDSTVRGHGCLLLWAAKAFCHLWTNYSVALGLYPTLLPPAATTSVSWNSSPT